MSFVPTALYLSFKLNEMKREKQMLEETIQNTTKQFLLHILVYLISAFDKWLQSQNN